jgi:hypothetical protein
MIMNHSFVSWHPPSRRFGAGRHRKAIMPWKGRKNKVQHPPGLLRILTVFLSWSKISGVSEEDYSDNGGSHIVEPNIPSPISARGAPRHEPAR